MSSPIKATIKTEIIPIILIIISILASFYFYANFPEKVPTHWNYKGEIDGWSAKGFAAFFFPGLNLGMYLLFLCLPYFDPKRDKYIQFHKPYHVFKNLLITFMTGIYFLIGFAGLGFELAIGKIIPVAVGILFLIIGNYLGKIKSNWFMGIRTPWTLSSEEVWNKTHRLGGKMFMLFGLLMICGIFLPSQAYWIIFLASVFAVAIVPMVYSFFLFKKNQKNNLE